LVAPALVGLAMDVLSGPASGKHILLETLTSMTRTWLVLLQPWKAPRLYKFYLSSRSPNPKSDTPEPASSSQLGATARHAAAGRYVDVALLGLEPEAPGVAAMQMPSLPLAPEGSAANISAGQLVADMALSLVPGSLAHAAAIPIIPGAGDARTWRSYVSNLQGAYCLLQAFLLTPAHHDLCQLLCKRLAENKSSYDIHSRRHVFVAMKVLAQTLLCFTDPLLLQVLAELPARRQSSPGMVPIVIDGGLHPDTATAVSLTWAALLAVHKDYRDIYSEFNPLLCAISRQLSQTPLWQGLGLPTVEDASAHRAFAQRISPSSATVPHVAVAASAAAVVANGPAFVGSEWQRPKRGGEVEFLLLVTYWLAMLIDKMLGRELMNGLVPQTEWPRLFANWKLTASSGVMLFWAVMW